MIPLAVDRLPGMIGVLRNREGHVIGSNAASLPVRLRIACWNAKGPGARVIAKVFVETAILLAGNEDVIDGIGNILLHRGQRFAYGQSACFERQASAREEAEVAQ